MAGSTPPIPSPPPRRFRPRSAVRSRSDGLGCGEVCGSPAGSPQAARRRCSPHRSADYRNNGDGTFTRLATGSLANDAGASSGIAWGDYDNDGFLDLFVANGVLGPAQNNFLYRNNGNGNNWVKVKCVGTASNRAGIGAKVRVKAIIGGQTRWQMRQIDGGDGSFGGSLEVDFGLGDAKIIDTLEFTDPNTANPSRRFYRTVLR